MDHNDCPHAIFCSPLPADRADGVAYLPFETSGNPYLDKLRNMAASPFEKTIYLDSDVRICGDITDLAEILGAYDVAAAHAPGYRGTADPEVPYAFFELNTGVVAYLRTPEVCTMLEETARTYEAWCADPPDFFAQGPGGDQPALRRCLWQSNLKVYVIGSEYNYRSTKPGFAVDEVRVIHGRHEDLDAVAKTLNNDFSKTTSSRRLTLPRVFPAFPVISWAQHESRHLARHGLFVPSTSSSHGSHKAADTMPAGVITGIPRSGTSFLCSLIHELRNHVVISEPAEVFGLLNKEAPGNQLAHYYRDLRRRILAGEPVENKTEAGKIITDTAKLDIRTAAPVPVQQHDFTLWTKNPIAYLSRLPQLLEAMPEATFIACVRHPLDTIASWSRTFPHLCNASVEKLPVGHPTDPHLTSEQRDELAKVAACQDLDRRRAMFWDYLARIVIRHQDRLVILRLEELARNPEFVLKCALHSSAPLHRRQLVSIRPSSAHAEIIEATCSANAAKLGYAFE